MAFDRQYAPQRLRRNVTRRETITGQQLEDFGTALPRNAAEGIRRRPVMSGRLSNDNLQSFLNIHTTDTVSMQDADVKFPVKAAVTVAIVLRGRVCGAFDDVPFDLDARDQPVGFIWALSQPVMLHRQLKQGDDVSKVMISAKFDWVASRVNHTDSRHVAIDDFIHAGISVRRWQPSRRAIALADQLLYPPTDDPLFRDLYAKRRGIEGQNMVRLVIQRDGTVSFFEMTSPSGSSILDRATQDMIERVKRFPPFPEDMARTEMNLTIPVIYDLR